MYYESMPLYPSLRPDCDRDACVRVPVFDGDARGQARMVDESHCRRVWIENPCRPGEAVEVLLSVDTCGNLMVCVRRDPADACCRPSRPPRRCPPPRPRCDGNKGRLYGSWVN